MTGGGPDWGSDLGAPDDRPRSTAKVLSVKQVDPVRDRRRRTAALVVGGAAGLGLLVAAVLLLTGGSPDRTEATAGSGPSTTVAPTTTEATTTTTTTTTTTLPEDEELLFPDELSSAGAPGTGGNGGNAGGSTAGGTTGGTPIAPSDPGGLLAPGPTTTTPGVGVRVWGIIVPADTSACPADLGPVWVQAGAQRIAGRSLGCQTPQAGAPAPEYATAFVVDGVALGEGEYTLVVGGNRGWRLAPDQLPLQLPLVLQESAATPV